VPAAVERPDANPPAARRSDDRPTGCSAALRHTVPGTWRRRYSRRRFIWIFTVMELKLEIKIIRIINFRKLSRPDR
jgi:hypothetical protein